MDVRQRRRLAYRVAPEGRSRGIEQSCGATTVSVRQRALDLHGEGSTKVRFHFLDCARCFHVSNWLGQDMRPANRMARMHAATTSRLGIDQASGVRSCLLAMVYQAAKDMPRNIPARTEYWAGDI